MGDPIQPITLWEDRGGPCTRLGSWGEARADGPERARCTGTGAQHRILGLESWALSLFCPLMGPLARGTALQEMTNVPCPRASTGDRAGNSAVSPSQGAQSTKRDGTGSGPSRVARGLGGRRAPRGLTAWPAAGSWAGVARAAASSQKASAQPCSCSTTSRRCGSRCECAHGGLGPPGT